MKPVSEMSGYEKSGAMAQLCGWELATNGATAGWWNKGELVYRAEKTPMVHEPLNLYDSVNMPLLAKAIEALSDLRIYDAAQWVADHFDFDDWHSSMKNMADDFFAIAIDSGMVK